MENGSTKNLSQLDSYTRDETKNKTTKNTGGNIYTT